MKKINNQKNEILICLLLIINIHIYCQTQPIITSVTNINLPSNNLGVMPDYIVEVDKTVASTHIHKLYIYGTQGIIIYNLMSSNCWTTPSKITISSEPYGFYERRIDDNLKTFPVHQPILYIPDNTFGKVFAVGPDLSLWYIDVLNDNLTEIPTDNIIIEGHNLDEYNFLSTKLAFDIVSNSLIWVANISPDDQSINGTIIAKVNLLAIPYIINYYNFRLGSITDFVVNPESNYAFIYAGHISNSGDYNWYILNRNDFTIITGFQLTFRPGLIKSVFTEDIHQIFCLPHSAFSDPQLIYIFDGDSQSLVPLTMNSQPSFICASFNDDLNYLILGADVIAGGIEPQDIYIYQCRDNNLPLFKSSLNTNIFSDIPQNIPLSIEAGYNNDFLLMKKHEIVKLTYHPGGSPPNYTIDQLIPGFGNYYGNAEVTNDSRVFITKMMGGGFLEFNLDANNNWTPTDHQTGQVLHSCFTSERSGNKYYFSKRQTANSQILIDNNNQLGVFIPFSYINPISDCIYNPYLGHILISDYSGANASINAFSENLGTLQWEYGFSTGSSYNGRMYISNDGKLLYFTGVNNNQPAINIRDASNYSLPPIAINLPNDLFPPESDNLEILFSKNPYQTYFVVSDNANPESDQYFPDSFSKSYFYVLDPQSYSESPYIEIDHDTPRFLETTYGSDKDESLDCNAFVAGTENYFSQINIDPENLAISVTTIPFEHSISALKYVKYGYVQELYIATYTGGMSSTIFRYVIKSGEKFEVAQLDSRISSMSYDSELGLLYLYGTNNDNLVIHQIDVVGAQYNEVQSLNLGRMVHDKLGSHVEMKVNDMIFDDQNHKIYVTNGEFSSISKIGFEFDRLHLNPKISWLSFPRLYRDVSGFYPSNLALNGRVFPEIDFITSATMEIDEVVPGNPNDFDNKYIQKPAYASEWSYDEGHLESVSSHLGYIISFPDPDLRTLELCGPVFNPNEEFNLYSFVPNWTGYFLPKTQSPFDAISSEFLEHITWIAGQYWYCHQEGSPGGLKTTGSRWRCACEQGRIEIKYGEMVKIFPAENIENFHWQTPGQPSLVDPKSAAEYFQYQEQSSYDPYLIELDTTNLPLEIGAFAGDSCIGATKVTQSDSLVLIRGFTGGYEGKPVSFEMYFGPEKTSQTRIEAYMVNTPGQARREKRTIIAGENQPWFDISFKNSEDVQVASTATWIACSPNPCKDNCSVQFFVPEDGLVRLEALDILGKCISVLAAGYKSYGEYIVNFSPAAVGIENGLFFIRLTTNKETVTKKIANIF